MLTKFIKRLNEPFPSEKTLLQTVRSHLWIALFIAVFLVIFKPFGLHNEKQLALQMSLSFGLVTFVFGFSFEFFTRYIFKLKTDLPSWTLWKWILLSMVLLCWIAIGNFLMMLYYYGVQSASLSMAIGIVRSTVILGLLPVFFSGLLIQMKAIESNQLQAQSFSIPNEQAVSVQDQKPVEFDLSSGQLITVVPRDVLYVEAMQNYVMLHYLVAGELQSTMIRSTIAQALSNLTNEGSTDIIRCHRSYLVNLIAVNRVDGNAQGLKLSFSQPSAMTHIVPVSRSYMAEFKVQFANVS